ncbi:hypothetical protein P4O66_007329, partial [Electrophorus voltai]
MTMLFPAGGDDLMAQRTARHLKGGKRSMPWLASSRVSWWHRSFQTCRTSETRALSSEMTALRPQNLGLQHPVGSEASKCEHIRSIGAIGMRVGGRAIDSIIHPPKTDSYHHVVQLHVNKEIKFGNEERPWEEGRIWEGAGAGWGGAVALTKAATESAAGKQMKLKVVSLGITRPRSLMMGRSQKTRLSGIKRVEQKPSQNVGQPRMLGNGPRLRHGTGTDATFIRSGDEAEEERRKGDGGGDQARTRFSQSMEMRTEAMRKVRPWR